MKKAARPGLPTRICRSRGTRPGGLQPLAAIVLLLAMACIVFANVVLRYTTGDLIVWAEEVARHLMIWGHLLAPAWCCALAAVIQQTTCNNAVSTRTARVIRMVVVAGVGLFCLVMAYFSALYVWATRFRTTAATDVPMAWICRHAGGLWADVRSAPAVHCTRATSLRAGSYVESGRDGRRRAASI